MYINYNLSIFNLCSLHEYNQAYLFLEASILSSSASCCSRTLSDLFRSLRRSITTLCFKWNKHVAYGSSRMRVRGPGHIQTRFDSTQAETPSSLLPTSIRLPGHFMRMSRKHKLGSVHRRGQQLPTKGSICDNRGPYQRIRSILKPVFRRY